MLSDVAICRIALSWLGANPIISFEDQTVEAGLCKENYEFVRDAVLAEADWSFAMSEAELNKLAEGCLNGNAFQLPTDCLRVIRAYTPSGQGIKFWEVVGDTLCTDEGAVKITYVKRVEDVSLFSSSFIQALAARLAAVLAIPLTQNKTVMDAMWGLYQQSLRTAVANDGLQGGDRPLGKSYLVEARYRGPHPYPR